VLCAELLDFAQSIMKRVFYYGAYYGALLGTAAALSLSTPAAVSQTAGSARVQHVVVRGTGDAMEVEIQTSGTPVAPNTQAIVGPDRIVVDFPGALPASELRALKVNSGALKGVRAGLFFSNPPITRIVLDLAQPQSYQISSIKNAVVVKLHGSVTNGGMNGTTNVARLNPLSKSSGTFEKSASPAGKFQNASLAGDPYHLPKISNVASDARVPSGATIPAAVAETEAAPAPPKPAVTVTLESGMLHIKAERATLAQVLFEVQRQTQAEIAIPAGAEQEQVFADIGPAPARDVLGSLLNGSPYNFIFVGNEMSLERVILTRREGGLN
jgi:AMIN domain